MGCAPRPGGSGASNDYLSMVISRGECCPEMIEGQCRGRTLADGEGEWDVVLPREAVGAGRKERKGRAEGEKRV